MTGAPLAWAALAISTVGVAAVLARLTLAPARRVAPPEHEPRDRRRIRSTAVVRWGISLLAPTTVGVVMGPVPGVAAALFVSGVVPRWRRLRRLRTGRAQVLSDLPDTIDLFVALVRAGLTPVQAVHDLVSRAPPSWRPGFVAVDAARGLGRRFAEALDELPAVVGPPARHLADTLASADRYGHPLGPVLDRLSDDARAERRRQAEIGARRLPVRLSFPLVCCTLPSFVLLTIAPLLAGAFVTLTRSGGTP